MVKTEDVEHELWKNKTGPARVSQGENQQRILSERVQGKKGLSEFQRRKHKTWFAVPTVTHDEKLSIWKQYRLILLQFWRLDKRSLPLACGSLLHFQSPALLSVSISHIAFSPLLNLPLPSFGKDTLVYGPPGSSRIIPLSQDP